MKILDIPQAGKRGLNVSQNSRNGLVSRALVIPTNPRTDAQLRIRDFLSNVASSWRTLSQEERDAWTAAAKQHQSKPSVGQRQRWAVPGFGREPPDITGSPASAGLPNW